MKFYLFHQWMSLSGLSLLIFLSMGMVLVANFRFTPLTTNTNIVHSYTFMYSEFEPGDHEYLSVMSSSSASVMHHFLLTTRAKCERTGPGHVWRGLEDFEVIVNALKWEKIKTLWNKINAIPPFRIFFLT